MLISLFNHLTKKLPENNWLRVIFGLRGIVLHERYHNVAKLITKANCRKVLDVGSGGASQLSKDSQVLSLDVKRKASIDVLADASHLPFRDCIFDCVIAVDVLEHVKLLERAKAIDEMKRCGKRVLIHTPLRDDGIFMGKTGDLILFNYLKKVLNIVDENTLEHLNCGIPYLDELEKQGFTVVQPDWNLNLWLVLMKSRYLPYNFPAPVMTMLYLLMLRKLNNPPFWGAYLVYCNNA